MTMLLVTPKPKERESPVGWLLRVSSSNCLPSPNALFSLIGRTTSYEHRRFDPGWFSEIVGIPADELSRISYLGEQQSDLVPHFHGQWLRAAELNLKYPKICPECIRESGVSDSLWDLDLVICCPTHTRTLVDRCPGCKKRLTWRRPGMLDCQCGASLEDVRGPKQTDAVIQLHKLLERAAFTKEDSRQADGQSCVLDGASLRFILRLVRNLGNLSTKGRIDTKALTPDERSSTVVAAAGVLSDWPTSFHTLLQQLAQRQPKRRKGVTSRINDIKLTLECAASCEKENAIVREAFDGFLANWDGYLDGRVEKALSVRGYRLSVSLSAAARQIGVAHSTMLALCQKGKISHRVIKTMSEHRYMIPKEELDSDLFKQTPVLSLSRAARLLDLPANTLKSLRASGHFEQTFFGHDSTSYAVRDLEALIERLRKMPGRKVADEVPTITLGAAGFVKLYSCEEKAGVVRAILGGTIRVYDSSVATLAGLVVDKSDVEKEVALLRYPPNGHWKLREAARALRMRKSHFVQLVDANVVPVFAGKGDDRTVLAIHVERFAADYVCLENLLTRHKRLIRQVVDICRLNDWAVHPINGGRRHFLRRDIAHLAYKLIPTQTMATPTFEKALAAHLGDAYRNSEFRGILGR